MPVCSIGYRCQACWLLICPFHGVAILFFFLVLSFPIHGGGTSMIYFKADANSTDGTSYLFGPLGKITFPPFLRLFVSEHIYCQYLAN